MSYRLPCILISESYEFYIVIWILVWVETLVLVYDFDIHLVLFKQFWISQHSICLLNELRHEFLSSLQYLYPLKGREIWFSSWLLH